MSNRHFAEENSMKRFKRFEPNTKIVMVSRTIGELVFIIVILAIDFLPFSFRLFVALFTGISLLTGWILTIANLTDKPLLKDIGFYFEHILAVILFMGVAYMLWPYLGLTFMFALFPTIIAVTMVARFKKGLIISIFYVLGFIVLYFFLRDKPTIFEYLFTVPLIISVSLLTAFVTKEIERLAITDNLTSVYNQRYFKQKLESYVRNPGKEGRFALLLVDVDDFKSYNDNYGHLEGDRILKKVAESMSMQLRKTDSLSRYGGEEFVAILPEADLKGAKKVAEKIRTAVHESLNIAKVTVSVGISVFPKNGRKEETILKAADMAMYEAKRKGKNQVCVA